MLRFISFVRILGMVLQYFGFSNAIWRIKIFVDDPDLLFRMFWSPSSNLNSEQRSQRSRASHQILYQDPYAP